MRESLKPDNPERLLIIPNTENLISDVFNFIEKPDLQNMSRRHDILLPNETQIEFVEIRDPNRLRIILTRDGKNKIHNADRTRPRKTVPKS